MKIIERFSKDVDIQLPGSWCKLAWNREFNVLQTPATSALHYIDNQQAQIQKHEAARNNSGDYGKQFTPVADDSYNAEYQGGGRWEN